MTPWARDMNETLDTIHSDWIPMSWAFKGDVTEWVKLVWPRMQVHRERTKNQPTALDPLGQNSRVELVWDSSNQTAGVVIHGERSPMLEPGTLQIYMVTQWPDLFRMRNDGTTT
jgi:hypothetical protein